MKNIVSDNIPTLETEWKEGDALSVDLEQYH